MQCICLSKENEENVFIVVEKKQIFDLINIECFTCKLPFYLKEEKKLFFDYHKVFM